MKKLILILIVFILLCGCSKKEVETNYNIDNNKNNTVEEVYKAKLTMVGDFLFEEPYYKAISKGEDKNRYFSLVKDYFQNDDLSIGNMEVVIGNEDMPTLGGSNYVFCAPTWVGDLIRDLDMDVLSTANNHAYDMGVKGIQSTINYFLNTDILTVGTFLEKEERNTPKILNINNIKFGFLAYTMGTNFKIPSEYRYMMMLSKDPDLGFTDTFKNDITNDVKKLREKADVVIVLMHWGEEFTYTPNTYQKEMAMFLNSLGVDIIVGSHSHSIQPIEWINKEHKTLVYYSMGNFVSADNDISRTDLEFDNAYQVGLLSNLEVEKKNNEITISNVKTELIVNYYDTNMENFLLVPLKKYKPYEKSHYRYKDNFNIDYLNKIYNEVIPLEFH